MSHRERPDSPKTQALPERHGASRQGVKTLEKFVVEEIELAGHAPAAPQPKQKRKAPAWLPAARLFGVAGGLWLILVAAALVSRSPWPADETRLLAIAWETWQSHGLVPHLNGDWVAQPPFFVWLVLAGWKLIGVTDWWPRLLPALFGLANLALVGRIARRLWPASVEVARRAPLVLLGTLGFTLMLTLTLPDMLALFAVLVSHWALAIMWRARDMRAWLLLAAALAFGLLSVGPFVLVYVLPLALAAPLWANEGPALNWKYWYYDISKALLAAAVVQGIWLAVAARAGGAAYALSFFSPAALMPTLDLFPATQPWWWYLALMPAVLLPWSVWPMLWMRLWHIRREPLNAGLVFCLVWVVGALVLLSLFDVKQPPYLLPLVPAVALGATWLLFDEKLAAVGEDRALAGMTIPAIATGGAMAVLPKLPRLDFLPEFLWNLSPFIGVAILVVGIALAWLPHRAARRRTLDMVMAIVALTVFALLGAASQFDRFYRVNDVAQFLAQAQRSGRLIAAVGDYEGEFQFAGRLAQSLEVVDAAEAEQWAAWHPDALLVTYSNEWQPLTLADTRPVFEAPYQDQQILVWEADKLILKKP